jgi:hypothetical protein
MTGSLIGSVVFQSNKTFLSKLICKVTKSRFSHVFIILQEFGNDDFLILDFTYPRVVINRLAKYKDSLLEIFKPDTDDLSILDKLELSFKNESKDYYGLLQAVGLGLIQLSNLIGINIANPFTAGFTCCEKVLNYCINLFYSDFSYLDGDSITPEGLYRRLIDSKKFIKITKGGY